MKNKLSLYFISKPLQYFNVTNIDDANNKHLIVIDSFKDSSILANRASQIGYWEDVETFSTYEQAFKSVDVQKYSDLFIDSDYGFSKTSFLKRFKNTIINVYEEGEGTYINNIRSATEQNLGINFGFGKIKSFFIRLFYRFTGHQDFHGGSKFTNNIYVYNVDKYKNGKVINGKKILTFKNEFVDHLRSPSVRQVLYPGDVDFSDLRKKDVLLYVSSWHVDKEAIAKIEKEFITHFKLIKLHPHIKVIDKSTESLIGRFDMSLNGGEMLEFFVESLLRVECNLTILHYGTSALTYFDKNSFLHIQLENK